MRHSNYIFLKVSFIIGLIWDEYFRAKFRNVKYIEMSNIAYTFLEFFEKTLLILAYMSSSTQSVILN